MTYFFETYGCQMNIAESAAVEQLFIARGWTKADDVQKSDIVIINTCSVRATAENRIFGRLGFFSGLKAVRAKVPGAKDKTLGVAAEYVKDGAKPLTLVVMGCMAERLLNSLQKDYPAIDYVVGTFAKKDFGKIIEAAEAANGAATFSEADQNAANSVQSAHSADYAPQKTKPLLDDSPHYVFAPLSLEQGAFSTFVPIMHGCNNFCTYCIVPYVRGREVSRPVKQILSEIETLSKYGVQEITLLGQNVNSYSSTDEKFGQVKFPRLLEIICRKIEEIGSPIKWIRFESSHPKDMSEELIQVIAREEKICKHIHLAVQHGSSRILQKMNRRYTREQYLALVQKIRAAILNVSLTTDIMLGFPGETDADFEEALSLMKTVRYENAFMYYYNPREGTPAASLPDQVPLKTKKARLQKIIDAQLVITREEMEKQIGRTEMVLVERSSRDNKEEVLGKTERDERVAFKADISSIGKFVRVKLTALNGATFKGDLLP